MPDNVLKIFFEEKKEKSQKLQLFIKYVDIETINRQTVDFKNNNEIKNEIYKCCDKNDKRNYFFFNPFEHILSYINYDNFDAFKNEFNKEDKFSLLKFYNENCLYKNKNLEKKFIENIKEMLQTKIIDELFSQ